MPQNIASSDYRPLGKLLPVLDARLSYNGLREDYANDADLLAGLNKSKAALEAHFKARYSNSQPEQTSVTESPVDDSPSGSPVKFNVFKRSAVAVERVFSGRRATIAIRRASLKAKTIEVLMFMKARLCLAREASKKQEKAKVKAFEESL
ncbi:hypothetical protein B0H10DRAFT_1945885 [Mycena sp. CBHHK59/15]|nr:hypothetical protein B0H10DRAFT_1945885 [Mycena sp. CBHHK59/15]